MRVDVNKMKVHRCHPPTSVLLISAFILAIMSIGFVLPAQAKQSTLPVVKATTLKLAKRIPLNSTNDLLATFTWDGGCGDNRVQAWTRVGQSLDHQWDLIPVPLDKIKKEYPAFQDDGAVYYIVSHEKERKGCASKYLSGAFACGSGGDERRVQLWHNGNEKGVQWWNVIDNRDGTVTMENVYNNYICAVKNKYLGVDAVKATRFNDLSYEGLNYSWIVDKPAGDRLGEVDGRWNQVLQCGGCPQFNYKYTTGVAKSEDKKWVTTQSEWAELTVSQKLSVSAGPIESETEIAGTTGSSTSIEAAVAESFSITQGEEKSIDCNKRHLFQWVTSIQQYSIGGVRASFANSSVFLCTDNGNPPKLMVPKS